MLGDSLLVNLIVFGLGQAAAWGYLRTGRQRRGLMLMVGGWVLVDVALLARFAYAGGEAVYTAALLGMQAYSLAEFALFAYGRLRRRRPSVCQRRRQEHRDAFLYYLRDQRELAERAYRRLRRTDPWDAHATLSLGLLLARDGRRRQAGSMLRRARSLDRDASYADVIARELEELSR